MDWSKLDARLAAALAEPSAPDRYAVFVHLAGEADPQVLAAHGVADPAPGPVRTATLSGRQVERLSDQPWVSHLRLSAPLRLADPT